MKPKTVGRAPGVTPMTRHVDPHPKDVGIASGTIVLSLEGEMPVEFLSPGDRLITRDIGMARLTGITRTRSVVRAISVAAGSLGDTRPDQDLILPANQRVLIRDWRAQAFFGAQQALVAIGDLVDGEFICDLGLTPMALHQLHFAGDHVLYAGGLEMASGPARPQAMRPAA